MARSRKWTVPEVISEALVPANPDAFRLEHYLTYRISRISRLLDRQTTRFLSESFGISITERRTLARLSNHGASTVREIAANIQIDKGAISRALASLNRQGYATRSSDPNDGRSAIFAATPRGDSLEQEIQAQGMGRQIDLLNQLTPTERKHLYQSLGKIYGHLEETEREQSGDDETPLPLIA